MPRLMAYKCPSGVSGAGQALRTVVYSFDLTTFGRAGRLRDAFRTTARQAWILSRTEQTPQAFPMDLFG